VGYMSVPLTYVLVVISNAYRTLRHQDISAPVHNGAEVSRDTSAPDFTGAELSGHFGTSAEIPRDTSAPSVKNTYGLLFRQNRPTISTICRDLPMLQLVRP